MSIRKSTQCNTDVTQHVGREAAAIRKPKAELDGVRLKTQVAGLALVPARRRTSVVPAEFDRKGRNSQNFQPERASGAAQPNIRLQKNPRRRTIYVPSEDTTIVTIHPGQQLNLQGSKIPSTCLSQSGEGSAESAQTKVNAHLKPNRKPLAAAPKRAPLQPTLKTLQEVENQQDVIGSGPGKENFPPAAIHCDIQKHQITTSQVRRVSIFKKNVGYGLEASQKLPRCDDLSPGIRSKLKVHSSNGASKHLPQWVEHRVGEDKPQISMMNRRNSIYYGSTSKANRETYSDLSTVRIPSKLSTPMLNGGRNPIMASFPILREHIDRPEMFEDAWLDDQECVIQQLVNDLFDAALTKRPINPPNVTEKRRQLLQIYQGSECSLLYKRIQASLIYGALSPPEGSIADSSRLKCDVGLQEKLLSIWTSTYDLEILTLAAEVVVGREISTSSASAYGEPAQTSTERFRKRRLELFLTFCLLRNEDATENEQSSQLWCWRRTMLRSVMMIMLLDRAKEENVVVDQPFQASSTLKSSQSVLTELCALLLPTIGDIYRPLSHLDYHVHCVQYPLSEYQYMITNLATDLRDGVRLVRLVELLIWPPGTFSRTDETVEVNLPTGEILTTTMADGQPWVLSPHLKFPCISRAQRLYNVQIALHALQDIQRIGNIAEGLSAEDIVNGHREKTVTLLWGLVGKWGLSRLLDFQSLTKEIHRLRDPGGTAADKYSKSDQDDSEMLGYCEKNVHLLRSWAEVIGKRHGVQIHNLTTSFANGQVFGFIMDEYQDLVSHDRPSGMPHTFGRQNRLSSRLRNIGCSASFGKSPWMRHD